MILQPGKSFGGHYQSALGHITESCSPSVRMFHDQLEQEIQRKPKQLLHQQKYYSMSNNHITAGIQTTFGCKSESQSPNRKQFEYSFRNASCAVEKYICVFGSSRPSISRNDGKSGKNTIPILPRNFRPIAIWGYIQTHRQDVLEKKMKYDIENFLKIKTDQ